LSLAPLYVDPEEKPEHFDLVEEFESPNWLTATERFDGRTENLDPAIAPLVHLLNDLPGVMTTGSCQGHEGQEGDRFPYVGLHIEDPASLRRFIRLLDFADEEDAEIWVELSLSWRRSVAASQVDLPPGALALDLELSILGQEQEDDLPPTPAQLARFTDQLRASALRQGLLSSAPQ
jgi:hypothetical protein